MPSAKDSDKARGSPHLVHKATAVGAHDSSRALHILYSALLVGFRIFRYLVFLPPGHAHFIISYQRRGLP